MIVTQFLYEIGVLGENLIPLVVGRNSAHRTLIDTAHCGCAKGVVYAARSVGFTENETCIVQVDPADVGSNPVVGNEQTVLVSISVLCVLVFGHRGLLGGIFYMVGCRFQHIGVHRACIGKRHIMQGAVRQIAVYRSGDVHRRQIKIVSAARGEGKLFVRLTFHRQRDIRKSTCKVGLAVTVILLAEYLHGIVARCNVRRDFDFNRSAFGSRLCYSAVILCAVVIRQDDRDIFIFPCGRPFVIQRNGIVGGGADSFFRHGKIASTI